MIATHYILMAVPETQLAAAVSMACEVGPGGADEAGSFAVALRMADGTPWRGMCTAADEALIVAINGAVARRPELAQSAVWATTTLTGKCIAGSISALVGARLDWDGFLAAAGLRMVAEA